MAKFMFWNVGGNKIPSFVGDAARENDIDVVILVEYPQYPGATAELLLALNSEGETRYYAPPDVQHRIRFLTRYPPDSFQSVLDAGRWAVRRLSPPIGPEILLVAAHLPSKLHADAEDQFFHTRQISRDINQIELTAGHRNTVLVGDFNMSPFEAPMVGADGLHAVMDKTIAQKESRRLGGEEFRFFYNPMWNFLGDETISKPAGTYYYGPSGNISYYWHNFDQILLRPNLLQYYNDRSVKKIININGVSLISNGRIRTGISDHLPVCLNLTIEAIGVKE